MYSLKEAICERLKQARLALGFSTAKAFALSHGLKISTYSLHEAGTREMSFETIEQYSRHLKINLSWLLTGMGPLHSHLTREAPLLVWDDLKNGIKRSRWETKAKISSDTDLSIHAFALRVVDDAMEPRYPKGTLLLVDSAQWPQNRDYALIQKENQDFCFRQLLETQGSLFAHALNEHYPVFEITPSMTILGKVVQAKWDC